MKSALSILALLSTLFISNPVFSQPCTMQGVYKIGPTGDFLSLRSALDTLRAKGVGNHVILELQAAYSSAGELFPLRFKNIPCIDSLKSVTIRPEIGATNRTISTGIPVFTIDLDSARFIKFDGRPGGVGTTSALTISNTSTSGVTVRFINDASWNTFEYVNILGVNASASSGVVFFSTSNASITNGNSFNKFINCNISKGSSNPANCIYSVGSSNKKNSNNQILSCNISDFYISSGSTNGIFLGANNASWKISGNSIFHSSQLNFMYSSVIGLYINDTTSSGFIIENNFIGGSAPNCGSARIVYGSIYNSMYLLVGRSEFTSVQNNTIANIGIKKEISASQNSAITLGLGKFRCGDIAGNIIGSETVSNSITIEVANDDFEFRGITAGTSDQSLEGIDTCYIKNNKIGGINSFRLAYNVYDGTIVGIFLNHNKKFAVISNNVIGNELSTVGITNVLNGGSIAGIVAVNNWSASPTLQSDVVISNNVICNLVSRSIGIQVTGVKYKVFKNVIHKLYALYDPDGASANLKGIFAQSGNDETIISGNQIHSLTCTSTSTNAIIGIEVQNSPGCTISKNFIHSFQTVTASGNDLIGLSVVSTGYHKIINNMIRLGIDTLGNSVSTNQKIFGAFLQVDSSLIANNSIYIGGGGFNQTAALMLPATNPGRLLNNIIVNNRSATGGSTQNQYAIRMDNVNTVTKYFNYNIYHATGTLGRLGLYKGVAYSTIISWRGGVKADSSSMYYNPNFINPNGNRSSVNLHIANNTPVEGQGILLTEVSDDFDEELRAGLTPVDIGADAGNFIYQDGDAPVLSHDAFLGQPIVSSFVYTLKVTDVGSGVDTNGVNKPKMWFRKKYPSISSWSNSPGNLESGNINNGTWGFRPDFSTLSLAPGDSIEYYFVAQDLGLIPNVGYSNLVGTVHQNVNIQTTAPTSPLRLLIYGIFPDTVYVGTGQLYTSLTNTGGYFHATQSYMVDTTKSSVVVIITSDLSETATYAYTPLHRSGPAITFKTNTPTLKNIHSANGAQNQTLIRMFNTSDMTIDGRVNGSGRYLLFSNKITITGWSAACMEIGVGYKTFTINNVIIENNSGQPQTSNAVLILAGQSGAPGPTVVRVENNIIRHANGGAGLPMVGIGIGATGRDSTIIRNNEISTFRQWGLLMGGSGNTLDRAVIIDGNHFYYTDPISAAGSMRVIEINNFNVNYFIKNNFIGGTGPNCSGGPFLFATASTNAEFYGIYLNVGADKIISIQNNTIKNIRFTQFGYHVYGMYVNTVKMNIGDEQGNIIGDVSDPLSFTNKQDIYGIVATGSGDALSKIENNIIGGLEGNYVNGYNIDVKKGSFQRNKMITGKGAYSGMRISLNEGVVEKNEVSGLTTVQDLVTVVGMEVIAKIAASSHMITVARNRIRNLKHETATAATLLGISCSSGENINNNQISLDNNNMVSPLKMIGLQLSGTTNSANAKVYYNSIRLGGNSTSTNNSYALLVNGGGPLANFKNNILYNGRSGGTGLHFAYGDKSTGTISWVAGANPDNNLYVNSDTARINEWRSAGAVSLSQWRSLMLGDSASYRMAVADLPSDSLFVSPSSGDLNINTLSPKSWYVNGKGMPISSISGDYDSVSNVRSTSVITGATDIGADEFNTNTIPPPMRVSGAHNPGGTEFFDVEGRVIASITWGAGGSLPTLGQARFYSGTWPNDTTNNNTTSGSRSLNSYWDIPASGGSNYNYNLTLYYDSSMLGRVTNANNMLVNKRQSGTLGSWSVITPTVVNTALKTITINNQTSFSEFTATDSSATFVSGSPLPDLIITNQSLIPTSVATGSNFTAQFTEANQGLLSAPINQVSFYLSVDNILTPGLNGDTLLGSHNIANPLTANSNTGTLTKQLTIPCNLNAGNYYIIFVADGTNVIFESNESNNTVTSPITITPGISIPNVPTITVNPSATVCSPATITLTANSPGCSSCTYSWSTGATGTSITVASSGTYTVTATNACGSSSATQLITVNTVPTQPAAISGNNSVCPASSQTYSVIAVAGATSYTWTLPSGWTGSSVTNSIITTAGNTSGTISVKASNNCGSSTDQTLAITVNTLPGQPGAISGNNSVCQGSSQTYSVTAVAGATNYTWTLPSGWTGSSTTNSIMTTVGTTGGTISVKANNSCGSGTSQSLAITVNTLPGQPATITGNNSVCQGSSQIYSVVAVTGATSYTWTLPSGWAGSSTTNSITTTVGSTNGTILVKANNSCGSSTDQSLAITVITLPAQPGAITGNNSVCQGSSQTFSVTSVAGATSYTWTLPSGWTGTSTSNSITTTVGNTSGTVSVKANNNCGSSTAQTLAVTVSLIPTQPASITGNSNVLLAQTTNYSISTLPSATSYNWQLSGGGTIQSGQPTTTISINWTTAGTYNLSIGGINNCGNGPVQTLSITVSVGTGIVNPDNRYEIKISPNPSAGEFYLTAKGLNGKMINIQILNSLGQAIYNNEQKVFVNDFTKMLDLKKIANGIYFIKISVDNKAYLRKIIKTN